MTTRRSFFRTLCGVGSGAVMATALPVATASRGTYGYMDVSRWNREGHYACGHRVYLDHMDVTDRCCAFDDIAGWADIRDGRQRQRVTGTVTVR